MPRKLRQVTLRGDEVILRPLRREHAEELWEHAKDPGLFEFLCPGEPHGIEALQGWIETRLTEEEADVCEPFVQVDPATGRAFGCTGFLNISVRHKRVEVGHTWIGRSHQRTRANTEAKLLLLRHAFEDWGAIRVQFKCGIDNPKAKAALERIGAHCEGRMRNWRIMHDGRIQDGHVFSIIKEEWPETERRLNQFLLGGNG